MRNIFSFMDMALRVSLFTALLLLTSFTGEDFRYIHNPSFKFSEILEYKVTYAFITAGRATLQIGPKTHKINGRECYKVDVFGETTGAISAISPIQDNWGSYIDTISIFPHISYRKLHEGKHRHHEIIRFDHRTEMAEMKTYKYTAGAWREPDYFKVPADVQDIVSGYYYLRTLDYGKLQKGDTIAVPSFFEGKIYDFRLIYEGKTEVDTKFGRARAILLVPIMPDNGIFAGENAISVWISDDLSRIPLKVKASLFVGSAELELDNYKGLKNELVWLKD